MQKRTARDVGWEGEAEGELDDANLKNTCTNKTVLNTNVTTGIKELWVVNAGNSLRIMCGL